MDRSPERSNDFGARLRRLREERGVALRDISDTTKISVCVLQALERSEVSRLPGGIFARSIVRAYAEQVGADPEKTVREFAAQFPDDSLTAAEPDVQSRMTLGRSSGFGLRLAIALGLLVPVAAVVAWAVLSRG